MVLNDVGGVVARPRRQFAAIAGAGRPMVTAAVVVAVSGAALGLLGVVANAVEPARRRAGTGVAGTVLSALTPLFLVVFWVVGASLVDAAAALMSAARRRRAFLVASAYAMPVLAGYGAVRVLQALLDRGGVDATVSDGLGLLDLLLLLWFIGLLATAARVVYDLSPLNAVAAALLPFAAITGVLAVLLTVASVLHAGGLI
jgi:hypothetical protein